MIRRTLAVLPMLLLTACTGDDATPAASPVPASPAAGPCGSGPAQLGKLTTKPLLMGASSVNEITAERGGPLDAPIVPVTGRTAAMKLTEATGGLYHGGMTLANSDVYEKVAAAVGEDRPLADLDEEYRPPTGSRMSIDGPGRFVVYQWIEAVEAAFVIPCLSRDLKIHGMVTTWVRGDHSGVIDCASPPGDERPAAEQALARKARELRC